MSLIQCYDLYDFGSVLAGLRLQVKFFFVLFCVCVRTRVCCSLQWLSFRIHWCLYQPSVCCRFCLLFSFNLLSFCSSLFKKKQKNNIFVIQRRCRICATHSLSSRVCHVCVDCEACTRYTLSVILSAKMFSFFLSMYLRLGWIGLFSICPSPSAVTVSCLPLTFTVGCSHY